LTINKLDRVMNGELDEIIDALILYNQTKQLEELADKNA
jgi:peptide chain release factor 1